MPTPLDPVRRAALVRTAARASVATAAALLLLKLGAWALTGSVSLLASLADSLMDAAASLLTLLALRWASAPPDDEHRFGHGKAESLAGLGQAAFISGSALFLALTAVERLRAPALVEQPGVGVAVMIVSMAATGALVLFQRRVVRLTGSAAVEGDALHYVTDLLSNLATLGALVLAGLGVAWADPLIALLLVAFIARSAWQLGRQCHDAHGRRVRLDDGEDRGPREHAVLLGGVVAAGAGANGPDPAAEIVIGQLRQLPVDFVQTRLEQG
jgi:ferrous-iron efflux pump FieF